MIGILVFVLSLATSVFAQNFPVATGHVNDFASLLSPGYKTSLELRLQAFDSTAQISVVTIDSLGGDTIENYSQGLFKAWGIGDKQKDTGLLLLVSKTDRKVRIETGYGLEEYLPDGLAGELLTKYVTPSFKAGNYDQGVDAGIQEITRIIQNKIVAPANSAPFQETPGEFSTLVKIILGLSVYLFPLIIYFFAYIARSQSIWLGGIIGTVIGFLLFSITGGVIGAILGLLFDFILSKNYNYFKKLGESTGWRSTTGGFYSKSSGGFWKSSGGGGFGGFGGGSSGGGGSSRSW